MNISKTMENTNNEAREFKVSEVVEKLKEKYKTKQIKLYSEDNPRRVGQPDEKLVTKAYNQYCDMWNSNDKSRGFVKYLVHNFLPIDNMSKVLSYSEEAIKNGTNKCCVLRIKLGNVGEIIDYFSKVGMQRLMGSAKVYKEGRTRLPKEQYLEIKKLQDAAPVEVKNATIGYLSKDEKKYLSGEALIALREFITDCMLLGEKSVEFLINKLMINSAQEGIKKEKRLNNKQINQVVARNTYGAKNFLDEDTISKLKELKKELSKD